MTIRPFATIASSTTGCRYCEVGGTTKTETLRAEEKSRAEVVSGDSDFTKTRDITIEEFSEKFLQRREDHPSHRRDVILVNHFVRRFYKMAPWLKS